MYSYNSLCKRLNSILLLIAGLVLFFERTSYTVSESAGSLEVCLFQDLETGASVAAGLQVEVNLAETSDTSLGTILF